MIAVNAIKCPTCNDIIYSRARHDCRHCSCGNIFIDGGLDYIRTGIKSNIKELTNVLTFNLKIDATKEELYADWNLAKDEYGLIKGDKNKKLKTVREHEKEWYKKQPFTKKIKYRFWYVYYGLQIKIIMFLHNLADKIDRH